MVTPQIPAHYTGSPSSFSGTPQLTINRDVTADLDSTNAFEGPEKLLEVWFSPSEKALPASAAPQGLKAVSQASWTEMLDLVNCKVLSVVESRNVDAYLLSESSMFVFPHKLVLKTCGTTTLLYGLPRMLEIAALEAGFSHVKANPDQGITAAATPHRVFYSRKNFLYPDQQRGPHRSWRDEVAFLDRTFLGGSAYMIGKMNGEHWYLYITGPDTRLTPPATPEEERFGTPTKHLDMSAEMAEAAHSAITDDTGDETLEILMSDLDVQNAKQFYLEHASTVAHDNVREAHLARKDAIEHLGPIAETENKTKPTPPASDTDSSTFDVFAQTSSDHDEPEALSFSEELSTEGHTLGTVVADSCGLSALYPSSTYPEARVDAYLFTPCGFSANGVVPAPVSTKDGEEEARDTTNYWTVHVTPEPQCSYASFETNVPSGNYVETVSRVVAIFKPGRFSVTLFEAKAGFGEGGKADTGMEKVPGYRRVDRVVHDLEGYELVFRYFERLDWAGGAAPRLGEW